MHKYLTVYIIFKALHIYSSYLKTTQYVLMKPILRQTAQQVFYVKALPFIPLILHEEEFNFKLL